MVLGLGDGAGGEEGGGVGGGGGLCACVSGGVVAMVAGNERRWMIAYILPACYVQMPKISKMKY